MKHSASSTCSASGTPSATRRPGEPTKGFRSRVKRGNLWRARRTRLRSTFSRSGASAAAAKGDPEKLASRFFWQPIGSHFSEAPLTARNCTGLQSLRLQNRVGSAQMAKPRPTWNCGRPQPLRVRRENPISGVDPLGLVVFYVHGTWSNGTADTFPTSFVNAVQAHLMILTQGSSIGAEKIMTQLGRPLRLRWPNRLMPTKSSIRVSR